ncbi:MAG: putative ABC transporter permease subunit [Thermoguttaceae bacterium]
MPEQLHPRGPSRPSRQPAAAPRLIDAEEESRAFWRMRAHVVRTVAGQVLSLGRFRLFLVVVLSTLLWLAVFQILHEGFVFLDNSLQSAENFDFMVHMVFVTFFGALLAMLWFSAGIILYASLFQSHEVTLLLTLPAREGRIFLHKFQEAVVFTGWGFLLLGSPMLLAYGMAAKAPWYYYAMLPPLMLAFTYIPVAGGGICCLLLVRYLPGARKFLSILVGAAMVVLALWAVWRLLPIQDGVLLTPAWLHDMLGRLGIVDWRLMPSWWLSAGLLEAARHNWAEGLKFLALMIANALFCRQVAIWASMRLYRPAYAALHTMAHAPRKARAGWLDRGVLRALAPLPHAVRWMIVKDLRLFRRDAGQWSQFLIFFGLLMVYFVYSHPFSYNRHYAGWVNMVSLLNFAVVGLLMSTFTTRFIFPTISLEGRRFWFLGLLPLGRDTILWSKFAFALIASLLPCSILILVSDLMLRVSLLVVVVHQLTCLLLCLGLSGIAVGLAARLPNLREQSPARITAGFGGTLTLVLSTLYILLIVVLTALPCHLYLATEVAREALFPRAGASWLRWLHLWIVGGMIGGVALGVAATIVPLWIGLRAFRRLEF